MEQNICEHLKEIAELAIKYKMSIIPDYYFDEWECGICNTRVNMFELIEHIKDAKPQD